MFILQKEKCNIDTSDGHEKNCQVSLKAEKCCIHCVNTAYEYIDTYAGLVLWFVKCGRIWCFWANMQYV